MKHQHNDYSYELIQPIYNIHSCGLTFRFYSRNYSQDRGYKIGQDAFYYLWPGLQNFDCGFVFQSDPVTYTC